MWLVIPLTLKISEKECGYRRFTIVLELSDYEKNLST